MKLGPIALLGIALAMSAIPASANTVISLTGSLDPNYAGDTYTFAFTASAGVTVGVQSYGYGGSSATLSGFNAAGQPIAAGGFDTYLSLFSGTGPSATFLQSNDDGLCPPAATDGGNCYDSRLIALSIPAGEYTLVLSVSGNMSYAENYGSGTLGDGFFGFLPADYGGRNSNWALDISTSEGSITPISGAPEPAGWLLGIGGILLISTMKILKPNGGRNV